MGKATRPKTLDDKTLVAGRGPTEFFPAAKTLDTGASNVWRPTQEVFRPLFNLLSKLTTRARAHAVVAREQADADGKRDPDSGLKEVVWWPEERRTRTPD